MNSDNKGKEGGGLILTVPRDVIGEILYHLPTFDDVLAFCITCKSFYFILKNGAKYFKMSPTMQSNTYTFELFKGIAYLSLIIEEEVLEKIKIPHGKAVIKELIDVSWHDVRDTKIFKHVWRIERIDHFDLWKVTARHALGDLKIQCKFEQRNGKIISSHPFHNLFMPTTPEGRQMREFYHTQRPTRYYAMVMFPAQWQEKSKRFETIDTYDQSFERAILQVRIGDTVIKSQELKKISSKKWVPHGRTEWFYSQSENYILSNKIMFFHKGVKCGWHWHYDTPYETLTYYTPNGVKKIKIIIECKDEPNWQLKQYASPIHTEEHEDKFNCYMVEVIVDKNREEEKVAISYKTLTNNEYKMGKKKIGELGKRKYWVSIDEWEKRKKIKYSSYE